MEKGITSYLVSGFVFATIQKTYLGLGNVIPFPRPGDNVGSQKGNIIKKSRLGNLLNFYFLIKNDENHCKLREKSRFEFFYTTGF
jgi:hypothetical protein